MRAPYEPLVPGALHVPNVNCDRCPYEKTFPDCDVFCARTIEDVIVAAGPDTVAAMDRRADLDRQRQLGTRQEVLANPARNLRQARHRAESPTR